MAGSVRHRRNIGGDHATGRADQHRAGLGHAILHEPLDHGRNGNRAVLAQEAHQLPSRGAGGLAGQLEGRQTPHRGPTLAFKVGQATEPLGDGGVQVGGGDD